jgi:hypothetical protein
MLIAQAVVERGFLDSMADLMFSALDRLDYYLGVGNTKWALVGLAVLLAIVFFKPKRR